MPLLPIKDFFHKNMNIIKKKEKMLLQGLQIAAFQQSFSQCWCQRPILEGSGVQKPT